MYVSMQELAAAVEQQQKLLEVTNEEKQAAEERLANFEATILMQNFNCKEVSMELSNMFPHRCQDQESCC